MSTPDDHAGALIPDDDGRVPVTLLVNGAERAVRVRPSQTLVDALREELGLVGTRVGCEVGMCGACTVLVDGEPINACLTLAAFAERGAITTIEGLGEPVTPGDVQQAYLRHRAFQCSYCTSGFIMATHAMLDRVAEPTEEDLTEAFSGHVCRCGSYSRILAAARDVAARRAGKRDDQGVAR